MTIVGIYMGNFTLLVVSRLFDGFTGGNISVAYSAIADISKPKDKPKNFGMVGMAFGLGFIIGPFVGGVLSDPAIHPLFNFGTPFIFSSLLAFINILLIIFNLPETLKKKGHAAINPLSGFKNIAHAFKMLRIRELLSIIFLITFGFTFFTQFFQVYLIEKFNFTQSDIGFLFAYVGIWIAITQGTIVRFVARKFESKKVLLVSILLSSITFPILLLPKNPAILYLFIPLVAIFQGVTQPNLTSIISNLASSDAQGEILGIQQSINALGLAIPPIIAGFIINIDINLPILTAGIMIFIAWLVYIAFYYNQSKRRFEDHI
jgi:DHA1 family tetracycline resistance protein-like MFS transporter